MNADHGLVAMRLARRGRVGRPPVRSIKETLEARKERVYAHLCEQYEPLDTRRIACELDITKAAANAAINALLAEGRVESIGTQHLRQGPPTRLFVAL